MAARVVNEACELKLPAATEVTLVTVVPPQEGMAAIAPVVWSSLPRRVDSLLKAAGQEADDRLRSLAGLLQSQYSHVRAEVYRGDPATCLAGVAEKEGTDLMILGTLGEGGMERLLLGSVSEQVARHVPCSVLLVR
jgi:nucleotide-binding universal stress UspA family protein